MCLSHFTGLIFPWSVWKRTTLVTMIKKEEAKVFVLLGGGRSATLQYILTQATRVKKLPLLGPICWNNLENSLTCILFLHCWFMGASALSLPPCWQRLMKGGEVGVAEEQPWASPCPGSYIWRKFCIIFCKMDWRASLLWARIAFFVFSCSFFSSSLYTFSNLPKSWYQILLA